MKPETTAKIKYGVWGLICGAVIAMIIGFAWGGWTTSGTTQTMTKEAGLASQAAICVAQFMKQPNHEAKLKELESVSSWQRAEVIEKGGWDKMPGQEKAGYAVAPACASFQEMTLVRARELRRARPEVDVGLRPTAFSDPPTARRSLLQAGRR